MPAARWAWGWRCLFPWVTTTALNFWQALASILVGGGILATAVWGGFHSNGFYRGQPAAGKLSLIAALMPGCALVIGLRPCCWSNRCCETPTPPSSDVSNDQGRHDL